MNKSIISTDQAPSAIGTYSQAARVGNTVYISGQIPLDPETMEVVSDSFEIQAEQVFTNLKAITKAAGGDLSQIVKLTILLQHIEDFGAVNEVMARYFDKPYPARSAFAVKQIPKGSLLEVEAIMVTE